MSYFHKPVIGKPRYNSNNFRRPRQVRVPRQINPSLFVKKATFQEQAEYIPMHTFSDFKILDILKQNIAEKGYTKPTPIQDQVIPHLLEGRDIVGIANTGTGKTAAFLIPLIHKVKTQPQTKVLIIAPTRELAVQIEEEFKLFARNMGLYSALCIGGVSLYGQKKSLYRNPQFVIGTPGRLMDLEQQKSLTFGAFSTIVLDEVDRMLDMGFIHNIRDIISKLPAPRHSLFFSATIPHELTGIMNAFLKNPVKISVQTTPTSENVEQDVVRVDGRNKVEVLHDLLITKGFDRVLVFGRTKHGMNKLAKELADRGFKVAAIHGNKSQSQRQKALNLFKDNHVQVLLATDVASRGLDIEDVTHVINYDQPESYEDYIHRIGRTGRADKTGVALTFV